MKRTILYLLASLAIIAGAAVFVYASARGKPVLRLYIWADYIAPAVLADFEREFGCEVRTYIYYSNEEMYAKLKEGGVDYDIAVPSSYMAAKMAKEGMVRDIDHGRLPNVAAYIDRSYLKDSADKEMRYSVPYFVSFTGIGYDKGKVKDFEPTWKMFEREGLKCSLLDDQREVIGAALKFLGKSVNSTAPQDIAAATEVAMKWKKQGCGFDVDAAKLSLASGQLDLIQTYSGDILQEMDANPNLLFVIPREGSTFTLDNLVVLKGGRNPDLALKFINFLYRPDVCAKNMNAVMYVAPNPTALQLVDKNLRDKSAFTIAETNRAKCEPLLDLGEKNALFEEAWKKIRDNPGK